MNNTNRIRTVQIRREVVYIYIYCIHVRVKCLIVCTIVLDFIVSLYSLLQCQTLQPTPMAAKVLIRWSLQHNLVVIPKSIHEDRILENSQVFDFQLRAEDMKLLDSLNENLQTVFLD